MTRDQHHKFNCGDKVCRASDPRHVGRVEAINWSSELKVRWEVPGRPKGYVEHFDLYDHDLVITERVPQPRATVITNRPATYALSPLRRFLLDRS